MAIMNKNGGMRSQRDDSISGVPTEKYKSNYDRLFGKKSKDIPYNAKPLQKEGVKLGELQGISGGLKTGKSQVVQGIVDESKQ